MSSDKTLQKQAQKLLEIEAEGKKRNWILRSTVYGGAHSTVEFTCGVPEHTTSFTVYASDIEKIRGCKICNPRALNRSLAKREEDFRAIVKQKKGTIRGGTFSSVTSDFHITCFDGHKFTTKACNILRDTWCPQCHEDKRKLESAQKFHDEVTRRKGTCTDTYVGDKTELLIVCRLKHEFRMRPDCVKQGKFCPKCAGNCPVQGKQNFEAKVKEKEGTCIGEYVSTRTLTKIRCKVGHEFMMQPYSVKKGHWCPVCAEVAPYEAAQKFYAKIEERGGTRIGDYVNTVTKVRIRCAQKHTFASTPSTITAGGTWCPICRESKGGNEVRNILISLGFSPDPEYYTPETGLCRYDFHVIHNGKHIFIEYDGEQHFGETYFHTGDDFLRVRGRDIFKTRAVIQHPQRKLIRIDYKFREAGYDLKQFIEQALASPELFIVSDLEMYSWLSVALQSNQLPPQDVPYTEDDSSPTTSPEATIETVTASLESVVLL